MSETIDLGDLTPAQRDVTWKNKRGEVERHVVREASAAAAAAYRNATSRASRYEDGKFVGLDGIADAEPLLVGLCVYRVDDKGGAATTPIGTAAILALPDRVQSALYETVRDISPTLARLESLDSVERQLTRLNKRRDEILAEQARAGGAPDPNAPPPPGGGTSATAAS